MILFPPAKVNLGLNIHYKRDDGFHELTTCMVVIPINDILEVLPADELIWKQSGLAIDGNENDNLCVKAFRLIQERYQIPGAYIHLNKQIPMGAGLGGGSADATYVLLALNEIYQLNISRVELEEMAATLGSDCPFFVTNFAKVAKGRGEQLEDISLSLNGYYIKLINPGIHIGTGEAYSNVHFSESTDFKGIIEGDISSWKTQLSNDFEVSAFKKYPVIKELIDSLYNEGALYAQMSGSGSTVFGLFKDKPEDTSEFYCKVVRFTE